MVGYYGYYLIAGILSMVGMWVSARLKSKFEKYSRMPLSSGLSGAEVAAKMLRDNGITDVKIVQGQGMLTDHYHPIKKIVSLSPEVYQGRSVAAAAVAAHECGHAVQHAEAYAMLQLRSALVPVVQIAATAQQWLLILAFMMLNTFPMLMLFAIGTFLVTTLFSFITLPVEFDASRRALVWLDESGIAAGPEHDGAKDALWWAAMTYVAAALSSLVMLLYMILRYSNSR